MGLCLPEGLIKPPFFIQTVMGVLNGHRPHPENLMTMRWTANRLFGRDAYQFSVLGAGRHQMPLVTIGAILSTHVRVGLEDSLPLERGELAVSCAGQVSKVRHILKELSLDVTTVLMCAPC